MNVNGEGRRMLCCDYETSRSEITVEFSAAGQSFCGEDGILPGILPSVTVFAHSVGEGFYPPISPVLHFTDKLWEHFLCQKRVVNRVQWGKAGGLNTRSLLCQVLVLREKRALEWPGEKCPKEQFCGDAPSANIY